MAKSRGTNAKPRASKILTIPPRLQANNHIHHTILTDAHSPYHHHPAKHHHLHYGQGEQSAGELHAAVGLAIRNVVDGGDADLTSRGAVGDAFVERCRCVRTLANSCCSGDSDSIASRNSCSGDIRCIFRRKNGSTCGGDICWIFRRMDGSACVETQQLRSAL